MQNVPMQTPLLFNLTSLTSLYQLVDSETKASFAQNITTIQLLLSRGCHGYTFVLFFSIKDNIA